MIVNTEGLHTPTGDNLNHQNTSMAAPETEIKTEPWDDYHPIIIKKEELIIKSEIDEEFPCNQTQVSDSELQNAFDLLIPKDEPIDEDYPKDEPIDEDYPMESTPSVEHENATVLLPQPPSLKSNLQCDQCNRSFANQRSLTNHKCLRSRNDNVCHVCNQVFRSYMCLQYHLQKHKEKISPKKDNQVTSALQSNSAKKRSPNKSPQQRGRIFTCNICDMTFPNPHALKNHRQVHKRSKHICNQCGKSFKNFREIKRHTKGDTCVREAIADVLRMKETGDDNNIKEEVVSEESKDGPSTQQTFEGSPVASKYESLEYQDIIADDLGNLFAVKKENLNTKAPEAFIKKEPVSSNEEQTSTDSQDFDELILKELIERKAKLIAKERGDQITVSMPSLEKPPSMLEKKHFEHITQGKIIPQNSTDLENTDFEDVIASNTLVCIVKEEVVSHEVKIPEEQIEVHTVDVSQHSTSEAGLQQADNIEEMIALQAKREVIENLKKEYEKATKNKLNETLEDSQDSSSATADKAAMPCSVYFPVVLQPQKYNDLLRRLDKSYRYTWICSMCPRRYIQRHSFLRHLTSTHSKQNSDLINEQYELRPEPLFAPAVETNYCSVCRVTLADVAHLKKHNKEFHKSDMSVRLQYKCDKCGKFCSTRGTLADHIEANCGREPLYGCDVCGKKFHTKSTLTLHKTMHTGDLPHKCTYCQKRFRTRGQLTVHTRTHTGERPFPCKVCERRFTHRETLIAHLSRHIDMKRYKCDGCQMFFSCISGLKTHRLTRMSTCGRFKMNARPVGPRVRVIKGNVIFEPQPKINPYSRPVTCDENIENTKENITCQEQNQGYVNDHVASASISNAEKS